MDPAVAQSLWQETGAGARLRASRHRRSGALHFPPFNAASPLACEYENVTLSGRGTVYSYSVIHPNARTGQPPFAIGFVDFSDGVRIFGRIETPPGCEPRIGEIVTAVPNAEFGYSFRRAAPAEEK